jgi:hypothetical protein
VILVEIGIVLVVAYLVYAGIAALTSSRQRPIAADGPLQIPMGGRWQPRHYAEGGQTVMTVARMTPAGEVLEEHVVARIPDADEDWSRKFLQAKQEAEERAFHLNADND